MNHFFSSMLPYEIVMLLMGMVSFLALIFLMIWNDMKQRPVISLLPFFLVPVILAGYPSVQSIQFKDDGLSIQKYTQAVKSNPSDTTARTNLTQMLGKFKSDDRTQNNAEALSTVANAQLALGSIDSAALTAQKAATLDPASGVVKSTLAEVNLHIEERKAFQQQISQLSDQLNRAQAAPRDTLITAGIARTLADIRPPAYVDASSALVLAKAYRAMNQPRQSEQWVSQVLAADPGSPEASELKSQAQVSQPAALPAVTAAQQNLLQQNVVSHPVHVKVILKNQPSARP